MNRRGIKIVLIQDSAFHVLLSNLVHSNPPLADKSPLCSEQTLTTSYRSRTWKNVNKKWQAARLLRNQDYNYPAGTKKLFQQFCSRTIDLNEDFNTDNSYGEITDHVIYARIL